MDYERAAAELDSALRDLGGEERAGFEKGYLKSSLRHYGTAVPDITRSVKQLRKRFGVDSHADTLLVAEALWERPVYEMRTAAAILLRLNAPRLGPSALESVERMLRESRTWALVDNLAVHTAGPLLERRPDADRVVESWGADDDFWMRRSALLAHLRGLRAGEGNWERFAGLADRMLSEREFFIRKAIGWILRDTARLRPEMVFEWFLPRAGRASGVTVREVVKRLPDPEAAQVLAAYRAS